MTTRYSTRQQNVVILQYTLLKMWEPERQPQASIEEASAIIKDLFAWSAADRVHDNVTADRIKVTIVLALNKWFPEWDGSTLKRRFFGKKKKSADHQPEPAPAPAEPTKTRDPLDYDPKSNRPEIDEEDEQPEPAPQPVRPEGIQQKIDLPEPKVETKKPKAAPKAKDAPKAELKEEEQPEPTPEPAKPATTEDPTIAWLTAKIGAGHRVFWLTGPSGSGKTTIGYLTAEKLGVPCTIVSCSAGTSPAEFRGFQFPEPRPSAFTSAYELPGITIVDEITALDPSVAAVLNASLANQEINTTTGVVRRHPDRIIIATSNTMGTGSDRLYIGNNQLDAATLDRFKGGRIHVDYNLEYERTYDPEVVGFVHRARAYAEKNKLRRIVSTRAIITACKDKAAGLLWRATVTDDWTPEEIAGFSKSL